MLTLTLPDGSSKQFPPKTTPRQVAESIGKRLAQAAIAARFDGAIVDRGRDELGQLARAFEQMRVRLASLDSARAEFIANASHELRTPLFALGGFLELLVDDDALDAQTRRDFLLAMQDQISRLTSLAMVLLDLSRLDAGALSVAAEGVDLATIAQTLAADIMPRAEASGHAVRLSAEQTVIARGDEARILQIGRILLDNAVVHTPSGCTIEIAVGSERGKATLSVTDDGPGIPAELHTQVFERFYRLGGSVASGSGLGLAIARALAEVMGGSVELDSVSGKTRFRLLVPLDGDGRANATPRTLSPEAVAAASIRII